MPFLHSLSDKEIADQLAGLLNAHNQLGTAKSAYSVSHTDVEYIVETHGQHVIAAVGLDKQGYSLSEIKHLVVTPQWRGKGVGKFLVKQAIRRAKTPLVYATVREDNPTSLGLFTSMGFQNSASYNADQYRIILLTKVNDLWKKEVQFSFGSPLENNPTSQLYAK